MRQYQPLEVMTNSEGEMVERMLGFAERHTVHLLSERQEPYICCCNKKAATVVTSPNLFLRKGEDENKHFFVGMRYSSIHSTTFYL